MLNILLISGIAVLIAVILLDLAAFIKTRGKNFSASNTLLKCAMLLIAIAMLAGFNSADSTRAVTPGETAVTPAIEEDVVDSYYLPNDSQERIDAQMEIIVDWLIRDATQTCFTVNKGQSIVYDTVDFEQTSYEGAVFEVRDAEGQYTGETVSGDVIERDRVIYMYSNTKTYDAINSRGGTAYDFNDVALIGGKYYHIVYLDCSTFLSMVTRGRNYRRSVYSYSFNEGAGDAWDYATAFERAGEITDRGVNWTMDWMGNTTTGRMLLAQELTGSPAMTVSVTRYEQATGGNGSTFWEPIAEIDDDVLSQLSTGDILYRCSEITARTGEEHDTYDVPASGFYKGCVHCGMYIKDLDEFNRLYAAKHGVTIKALEYGSSDYSWTYTNLRDYDYKYRRDEGLGYVVEFTGSYPSTGLYAGCLRVSPLSAWINNRPPYIDGSYHGEEVSSVLACKYNPNVMLSSRQFSLLTKINPSYGKIFFDTANNGEYKAVYDVNNGNFEARSIGAYGIPQTQEYLDLNDYVESGVYKWHKTAAIDTALNVPAGLNSVSSAGFTLLVFGSEKDSSLYTTQILTANHNSNTTARSFIRTRGNSRWSSWQELTTDFKAEYGRSSWNEIYIAYIEGKTITATRDNGDGSIQVFYFSGFDKDSTAIFYSPSPKGISYAEVPKGSSAWYS